jgi:hypothetical protein
MPADPTNRERARELFMTIGYIGYDEADVENAVKSFRAVEAAARRAAFGDVMAALEGMIEAIRALKEEPADAR